MRQRHGGAGGGRAAGRGLAGLLAAGLLASAAAAEPARQGVTPERPYVVTEDREPCAGFDPLRQPFFGDTHVHTAFSQDASTQGTRNTPRDAYRFARGEPLGIQPYDAEGRPLRTARLERPLDFAAVTDHAEQLGEVHLCSTPGASGYDSWVCRLYRGWPRAAFFVMNWVATSWESRFDFCGDEGTLCLDAAHTVWEEIQAAAEGAYDRSAACGFTSFVGYEWTASARFGRNLHRNVIFRNERVPALPASVFEARTATALWDRLQAECLEAGTGCDVITIPHNANLSNGLMFESAGTPGTPIDAAEAARRARFEPLVEVMQHKGDSECLPGAADELCAFEKLPYDYFGVKFVPWLGGGEPGEKDTVRWALGEGLRLRQQLGENPFRFGLVASTDTHLGTPGLVAEEGHPGHGGAGAPAARSLPRGLPDDLEYGPGGLAVLWAEENTRDALFAAMQRREAYGTSGTRPLVRFFGGWDWPEDLCRRDDFVARGYADGVPMGGMLPPPPPDARAPAFAVWALRDPGTGRRPGTPLQRIQIVKGWLEDGDPRERVLDVAGGDNGASVELATCAPRGEGADQLCRVWRDPDFDPAEDAFYYARVVENPTCRWSQYACNAARVDCADPDAVPEGFEGCCSERHRRTVQERAWTSPIWYAP